MSHWRRHPDLNWGSRCCRPMPYHLAIAPYWSGLRGSNSLPPPWQGGALPDELHPHPWCLRSESNQRHEDFQSSALPTELSGLFLMPEHKKLRGQDLNLRPSGYEPDELPDCSTPRYEINGWRWIRTTEAICSRFTVCPLWPLGKPPIKEWDLQGSNL